MQGLQSRTVSKGVITEITIIIYSRFDIWVISWLGAFELDSIVLIMQTADLKKLQINRMKIGLEELSYPILASVFQEL
jgi:hypothetical protein